MQHSTIMTFIRRCRSSSVLALILGIGALVSSPVTLAEGKLNIYNWGDYINPDVLTKFTEDTGIEVTLDTYGTNEELLAKIQSGAAGYDIVFPSVHMRDIMQKLGLLHDAKVNTLKGFENIDPANKRSKVDPESSFCLPYAWGAVGVFYNKAEAGEIKTWDDFFALADKGKKITMLDDLRETIGVALIKNGHSVNTGDADALKQAEAWLLERKDKISAFSYDIVSLVQSGDIAAAHWYVGATFYTLEEPDKLGFVIPDEGATMYQEDICVLKDAPNKGSAIKFMEFYMQPEVAALNTLQQVNGTANVPARDLLPPELKANPNTNPSQEVIDKLQIFEDLGNDLRKYNRVWTKVKTAQ
ncbi:MAG: spermidine/putrescine ABC transporter substrate-binding protein [Granulosicoccus sp.]|nr:spermidine/putrescine ABC transporter substrate-binding protein [Granulosicoccus sp.]